MFTLKKIVVCLDLSKMDEFIIRYVAELVKTMQTQHVYYINIRNQIEVPQNIGEKYPELYGHGDSSSEDRMKDAVAMYFPEFQSYEPRFIVEDGSPSEKILGWSEVDDVDLLVMGKKSDLKGKGVNPKKIANISHCSCLFIPENPDYALERLFVPIDFSERSKAAISQASEIRKKNNARVILNHVYFVPEDYHFTGKTYDEFAEIMLQNAREDYAKFMSENDYDPQSFDAVYTLDDDDAPADKIYLEAERQKANLIILASRGRTKTLSLLLGSVAIELMKFDEKIPYMLIKNKTENIGFFKSLFGG